MGQRKAGAAAVGTEEEKEAEEVSKKEQEIKRKMKMEKRPNFEAVLLVKKRRSERQSLSGFSSVVAQRQQDLGQSRM